MFQRDPVGEIFSLTWQRGSAAARTARRVEIEKHETVEFSNDEIHLAGRLIAPSTGARHPAIVLVHGSGAETREHVLPLVRFLVRHGIAVLGYDKRGVGQATGDWNTATFEDLAGDAGAAVEYLKTRKDRRRRAFLGRRHQKLPVLRNHELTAESILLRGAAERRSKETDECADARQLGADGTAKETGASR